MTGQSGTPAPRNWCASSGDCPSYRQPETVADCGSSSDHSAPGEEKERGVDRLASASLVLL